MKIIDLSLPKVIKVLVRKPKEARAHPLAVVAFFWTLRTPPQPI